MREREVKTCFHTYMYVQRERGSDEGRKRRTNRDCRAGVRQEGNGVEDRLAGQSRLGS